MEDGDGSLEPMHGREMDDMETCGIGACNGRGGSTEPAHGRGMDDMEACGMEAAAADAAAVRAEGTAVVERLLGTELWSQVVTEAAAAEAAAVRAEETAVVERLLGAGLWS